MFLFYGSCLASFFLFINDPSVIAWGIFAFAAMLCIIIARLYSIHAGVVRDQLNQDAKTRNIFHIPFMPWPALFGIVRILRFPSFESFRSAFFLMTKFGTILYHQSIFVNRSSIATSHRGYRLRRVRERWRCWQYVCCGISVLFGFRKLGNEKTESPEKVAADILCSKTKLKSI